MRRSPSLAWLLAALLLLSGCDCFSPGQPPGTAAEYDKFVADNPAIMDATRQAMLEPGAMDGKAGIRAVLEVQEAKIRELGWDLNRYRYIHQQFSDSLSCESLRLAINRWSHEATHAPSASRRKELHARMDQARTTLKSLREGIEARTSVAEQVFVHERMYALAAYFPGGVETFQTSGW